MKTYGRLREKIREIFGSLDKFAAAMDMNKSTISAKVNGTSPWTKPQIERACVLLDLTIPKDLDYFFY